MIERLVDSHVHFWNPERFDLAWLDDLASINRTFLPQDLHKDAPTKIEQIVFVQADVAEADSQREVEWVTELAQDEPTIAGIVACAPLEDPEKARVYLEHYAKNPLVKGIRRLIQSEAPGFAVQPTFIDSVRLLEAYGYRFDLCIHHHQFPDILKLVESCPRISFVLDHLGKPAVIDQLQQPWAEHLAILAQFPNVWCKVSGLITEADPHGWTTDDLTFYVDCVLENFGIERVMYGGDWPVVNLAGGYARWIDAIDHLTADLSHSEREALFIKNAQRFYGLG